MREADQPAPQETTQERISSKWAELSQDAQEAALMLAPAEQVIGVPIDYFEGSSREAVDELVTSGLVETKSRQEIAREFMENHRVEVENIKERMRQPTVINFSDTERILLRDYENETRVSQHEEENFRYRFTDGAAHDFVNTQFDNKQ